MNKYASFIKFIIIVIISGFVGGLAAMFFSYVDTIELATNASQALVTYSPYMLITSMVILLLIAAIYYWQAKSRYSKDGLESDESFDVIDRQLTIAMTLCSLIFIVSFLFFGIFVSGLSQITSRGLSSLPLFVMTLITFIVGAFGALYLQVRAIKMTKLLYPNKKGDPLELKFNKDWLESCDEAEQYVIFRSAYAAYLVVQKCILAFWLVAVFGAMFFNTGILPIIIVTVLWGILLMSYTLTSFKLEKSRLR